MSDQAKTMVLGIMATVIIVWVVASMLFSEWHANKYLKARTDVEEQRHLAMLDIITRGIEILIPNMAAILLSLCFILS